MLLKRYTREMFRPECNPGFQSLHCIAHLDQDVAQVLPYLNAVLGGFEYLQNPPAVTFRVNGRLITVHGRKIAINALKDEAEAEKIMQWLMREINSAWDRRRDIEPCYEGQPKPKVIEILKLLPQTNCRECGQATCMVFAARMAEGVAAVEDCPELAGEKCTRLAGYMSRFQFDD